MFIRVAVPRPLDQLFDYEYDENRFGEIKPGDWVRVSFGRTKLNACVIEADVKNPSTEFKIKSIDERLDPEFRVSDEVLALAQFGSEYYQYPLGEALSMAAPPKMDKKVGTRKKKEKVFDLEQKRELTDEQSEVLEKIIGEIRKNSSSSFLLHGVTGSGKTEIYIELARNILSEGGSVLILVPEIALTAHLKTRIEEGLKTEIALWHSAMPDGQRQEQWRKLNSGELKVVIGARSAIFLPLKNIGLIVVDEEHDQTYKQEERFRYQARDLAIYRAHKAGIPIILGSATPSVESMHKAKSGKMNYIQIQSRFSSHPHPQIEKISLKDEGLIGAGTLKTPLAETTIVAMQETINRGEQVLVFLNRRGYSQFILCQACGWVKECPECSISLTYYLKRNELKCHVCSYKQKAPTSCESCNSTEVHGMGTGTEALEEDLLQVLTNAKILRLDRDAVTSHTRLEETLASFRNEEANILVGTQMLVKGHDFPKVTCVVVVGADGLFHWPDFRASERAIQTLIQVSGRAGRADLPGRVLIQGYDLDHPSLKVLTGEVSLDQFMNDEILLRKELSYPPFCRLVRFRFEHANSSVALKAATQSVSGLGTQKILGPSEALLSRAHGKSRFDVYLKAESVEAMILASRHIKQQNLDSDVQLTVDVDPYSS